MENSAVILLICTVLSAILIYSFSLRYDQKSIAKQLLYVGHWFFTSCLLYIIYYTIYYYINIPSSSEIKFRSNAWIENYASRGVMFKSLLKDELKNKAYDSTTLKKLLGQPDGRIRRQEKLLWFYYVSFPDGTYEIDPMFITIEFDKANVIRYYQKVGAP